MATAKGMSTKEYCDEVLHELAYMIQTVQDLREQAGTVFTADGTLGKAHDRHLTEIADYLDWKLQILTTACPFDWKGLGEGVQDVVSVRATDSGGSDLAPGYGGG